MEELGYGPNKVYKTKEEYDNAKLKWVTEPGDTTYTPPPNFTALPDIFKGREKDLRPKIDPAVINDEHFTKLKLHAIYLFIMDCLVKKYNINLKKLTAAKAKGLVDYSTRIYSKILDDKIPLVRDENTSESTENYDKVSSMADELAKEDAK